MYYDIETTIVLIGIFYVLLTFAGISMLLGYYNDEIWSELPAPYRIIIVGNIKLKKWIYSKIAIFPSYELLYILMLIIGQIALSIYTLLIAWILPFVLMVVGITIGIPCWFIGCCIEETIGQVKIKTTSQQLSCDVIDPIMVKTHTVKNPVADQV